MNRFGEIPISPGDQQGSTKKTEPERDVAPEDADIVPAAEQMAETLERGQEPAASSPRRVPARKKKPDGGRRGMGYFAWLFLPAGIFLLYTMGSYFFVPYYIRGPLAVSLGGHLGRPVQIARAVFSPFTLRLFLEDITIGAAAGDQGDQQLLTCARIDCRLTLDRISSGDLVCEGIKVKDLLMHINRDAALSSDIADTWRLIVPAPGRTSASLWPSWLIPGEITLTGGTVLVDDPTAQKEYRVEQIELYLPPLDPKNEEIDRLPKLSAVISGSPVLVEAVRTTGSGGQQETSFDLKVKDVVLNNYLQNLPLPAEQRLKLAEGLANLELRIVFPRTGVGAKRVLLEGRADLSAVKLVDEAGEEVLSLPSAHLNFQVAPLAQRYRFASVVLEKPILKLVGKAEQKKLAGLAPSEMVSLLLAPIRTPYNFGIDQLQLTEGKVRIRLPGSAKKELALNEVNCTLEHFASPGVGLEGKKGGAARFTFKAVDDSGAKPAQLSSTGEILLDGEIVGQADLEQLDFSLYQDLIAKTGLSFGKGRGSVRFFFESASGNNAPEKEGSVVFKARDGELKVADYALSVGGKKVAAGGSLKCGGLQVAPADQRLACSALEFADSEIFNPAALGGILSMSPAKGKTWHLAAADISVKGSRVHIPLLKTLCASDSDLVLKSFSMSAKELAAENPANNIVAQAKIGAKGTVKVDGSYILAQNKGNLQISLDHLDLALFNPCLAKIVVPEVKQGSINIQGNVAIPAKEFSGQVFVSEMVAGEENGPAISWQLATSDRVNLRTDPVHLDLGEVMVRKPLLQPGIVDSENLLRNFLHEGKPSFQNLAIAKISIDDGQFSSVWPILLPGYQPRLEGVSGSLTSLGRKSMPFALSGTITDLGKFTITGKASMDRVETYSLAMPLVNLSPFADFFLTQVGMDVQSARGEWKQTMSRADNVASIATESSFQGLQPLAESPLLRVSALLLGENGSLRLKSEEGVSDDSEPTFLLTSVQRQLQRQAVRADISEELVLHDEFPKLQLPREISFAPGLAEPLVPEALASYKELFSRRPFLQLRLRAVIDNETDREALRRGLQEEADLKRNTENSRRAQLKQQREEREKERLAAIKAGKTPVVSEKIEAEELAGDLEPLPFVEVQVTEDMLAGLARKRLQAVQRYLLRDLAVLPAKVQVDEEYNAGPPQVLLRLEPNPGGGGQE